MTFLLWPKTAATPSAAGLSVPTLHARIAWRPVDSGLTALDWDGTTATGWTIDGSGNSAAATSLTPTSSDSFGGGSCLELVTAASATSGADWAFTDTFTSGRTYRFRVGLRSVSGTAVTLRFGNASDSNSTGVTSTTTWAWYTVDWTPSADRTDAEVSVQGNAITVRIDHAEVYEALEEVTLETLRVTRGRRFDGSRDVAGTIDCTILDPDDVYSPRNSGSALSGSIEPGVPIHVRAVFDGKLYALAYGRVRSITPDVFSKKVMISADDGLAELEGHSLTRPFSTDLAVYEARAAALSSEALAATQHDLATDSIEAMPIFDGTDDDENLLRYLDDLNDATGSMHWCKPSVTAARPWMYKTITRPVVTNDDAGTFIDEDFQRLTGPDIREEQFITRQRVSWRGYESQPSRVVAEITTTTPYWTYTDDRFGSTREPEDGYIFTIHRVPGQPTRARPEDRVLAGSTWVDAVGLELADGESKDIVLDFKVPMEDLSVAVTDTNGYVTGTVAAETARATVTLSASGGADTVTYIGVSAKPAIPIDEAEEQSDAAGAVIVREGSEVRADRLQSAGWASGLADYITWRYGAGRLRPTVVDQFQVMRQLALDIGSHVTLSADRWYIAADRYAVRHLQHELSGGGLEFETAYGLDELPQTGDDGNWITLDGRADQGIIGGTGGAFLDTAFYDTAFYAGDTSVVADLAR